MFNGQKRNVHCKIKKHDKREGSRVNKVSVMKDIDELTDMYCSDCLVIRDLRQKRGKTKAHQFCIEKCTVGEQLQFLGQELMKFTEREVKVKS
jgi:hypothetical protein